MSVKTPPKPVSEKQVAFIKKLAAERAHGEIYVQTQLAANKVESIEALSSFEASNLIGVLKAEPYKSGQKVGQPNKEAHPGYYVAPGDVFYEVVKSKQGRTYAKVLIVKDNGEGKKSGKWEYAPGAMNSFQTWVPASLDIAESFGKKFGVCMCCGRTLTKTESIERGIGPICADKAGW